MSWPLLALVRFLLAAVVLGWHVADFTDSKLLTAVCGWLGPQAAVVGFLILSGYSISHSIERQPRGFLLRRFKRIAPVYYVSLGLALVPLLIIGTPLSSPSLAVPTPTGLQIVAHLCLLQGFIAPVLPTLAPAWSLSIEAAFYAIAPLLRRVPVAPLVIASAALFMSRHQLGIGEWWSNNALLSSCGLFWAWGAGWMLQRRMDWRVVVIVAEAVIANGRYEGMSTALLPVLVALLLVCPWKVKLPSAAALHLGDLSYPLYLCHYPVLMAAFWTLGNISPWAYLALSLAVAALVHYLTAPRPKAASVPSQTPAPVCPPQQLQGLPHAAPPVLQ